MVKSNSVIAVFLSCLFYQSLSISEEQEEAAVILIKNPDATLTLSDFREVWSTIPEEVKNTKYRSVKELRQAIDQTYMTKVAQSRAIQKGLDKSPLVQADIANYIRNRLAEAEVDSVVEQSMRKNADFEALAKEYYLTHKDEFLTPAKVAARHILITPDEDEQQALQQIKEIREQIVQGKISFEDAAKQYSDDKGSAPKGGDLGAFAAGSMVKPFEEAAFSLKTGEVSEPVKTRFGYHLILVYNKEPSELISFEKVKQSLIEKQKSKLRQTLTTEYWLKIQADPEVFVDEAEIENFIKSVQR